MLCDSLGGGTGWAVTGRFKREGTYVYLWLIYVDCWQKMTKFCKAIILQLGKKKKNLPANARDTGDMGLTPGLERSPRERNGHPLQYFCLENPMDRGTWRATVHRVTKSLTQLSS